ncbi:MAG: acyl-CoA dehydratase activase [Candidatus Thermoplasmatota archaeon]|nr:acyl-CoA dehydratase activase [Candidatus Thermoplasmatota archaeon]
MKVAGVDVGAKFVKVILMDDGNVLAKSSKLVGFEQKKSIDDAFQEALGKAGVKEEDIGYITATGSGRTAVHFKTDELTEVTAASKGATMLVPSARTVIDVGAEEGRAMHTDADGKVLDFVINERCAAGAGSFTEAMARALEIEVEEIGPLSLKSTEAVPMNAQCAVFAESEVVTLVHQKTSKENIARAIHDAIASRISSMARRLSIEQDIVLVGGMANNVGFVESLKRELNMDVTIPEDPEYVAALGAARVASARAGGVS